MLRAKRYFGFVILILLFAVSCSTAPKKVVENNKNSDSALTNNTESNNNGLDFSLNSDSDSKKLAGLNTIHFGYSSAVLDQENMEVLITNIAFLKQHPNLKIQIEGHCDERGSVQFNLALGEKRAKIVKEIMIAEGIMSSRLDATSIGKERPISFGHNEDSWKMNRRANFILIGK